MVVQAASSTAPFFVRNRFMSFLLLGPAGAGRSRCSGAAPRSWRGSRWVCGELDALQDPVVGQSRLGAGLFDAGAGLAGEAPEGDLVTGNQHAAEELDVAACGPQVARRGGRAFGAVGVGGLGDAGPVALDEVGAGHRGDDCRSSARRRRVFPYLSAGPPPMDRSAMRRPSSARVWIPSLR